MATRVAPLHRTTRQHEPVDAETLAAELRRHVRGEVRFDGGSRALYAADAGNYRQVPIGVVLPLDVDDAVQTVDLCRRFRAPLLSRGGGTSLAGQGCNTAVVLDFSKYMHHVLQVDDQRAQARVQPGVIFDHLEAECAKHNLTFAPDTSTHDSCTVGGMIGNNSCGVHSLQGGRTSDNVDELDILTYDGLRMRVGPTSEEEVEAIIRQGGRRGEIYAGLRDLRDRYAPLIRRRYPTLPRRVSGFNLDELLPEKGFHVARALVGTEGTCAVVLEATLHLVHSPPYRAMLVLGYEDVYRAGDAVPDLLQYQPLGLEGLDEHLARYMHKKGLRLSELDLLPEGAGWLLLEFGGATQAEANGKAQHVMRVLRGQGNPPSMLMYDDPQLQKKLWLVRESGLGASAFVPGEPDAWEGWEDAAVRPERLGDYLRDFRALLERFGYRCTLYGHFGDGCVHTRIDFDLTSEQGIRTYRAFAEAAADLVARYDGSLSGEHGDGQARGELLDRMFGPELVEAFREFKAIWDPAGKMNPGKVVDPYRIDENLRLGTEYHPPAVMTHFQYPDDGGSFAKATLRCVGVGKCRRTEGGTMCPSYMVTREEQHTTRGRARLLFEMLQGNPVRNGWQDEAVKESLSLCLSCKGCKGECPVNVDVATYKAEFLSHYYEHHRRPRAAYAMGFIHWWSRLASLAPRWANFVGQSPGLSAVAKQVAGVAPQRQLPRFAPQTFKHWFRRREVRNEGHPPVILWPDTFNNHFHPEILRAGVDVLEAVGRQVLVPQEFLCCGRPLYDYGQLDRAKGQLQQILDVLRPQIRQGVAVVGLEPSCVSTFRDELVNLFPHDEDARRLHDQTYLLSEYLIRQVDDFDPPELSGRAVVHGHCHQKSILGMDDEMEVLRRLGIESQLLDSGCCGMAGAFGYEKETYDVGIACGERVLLPAVREAPPDAWIVADGFSCQEQIAQGTQRRALHLAQLLQQAFERNGTIRQRDERTNGRAKLPLMAVAGVLGVAAGTVAGQWIARNYQSS